MHTNTPTTPTTNPVPKTTTPPVQHRDEHRPARRTGAETKPSVKTTELIAYVVTVIGVLVASAVVDDASDFGAKDAWFFVTLLTIGYMISRGLAKAGSRDNYDADNR
jgi:hypothetical protein